MWHDLGISQQDWDATPLAVRSALLALQRQVRQMGIRFSAYEKQLASLREQLPLVAVLWRHKSFGTQSASGSRFVGRVLTAVPSLRQQGRDLILSPLPA